MRAQFKAFVSRHRNAMVVLGSLLVFGTFIVNEAIRDNLKEYIGSLEQAQSIFVLQRDHAAILIELESANRNDFETEHFVAPADTQPIKRLVDLQSQRCAHEVILFTEFGREYERILRSFISLADLLNKAPVDASYGTKSGTKLVALEHQQEDLLSALRNISQLIQQEGTALQNSDLKTASDLSRQVRAHFNTIQSKTDDFSNAMDNVSHDLYQDVEKVTDNLNSDYDTVTTISYSIYAIGWSFALLGKLYGIEVSPEQVSVR